MSGLPPLRRGAAAAPPARIVHIGLGAFARSHQAWYTDIANEAGDAWGIAGFSGRNANAVTTLASQGGLYHLLVRQDDHVAIRQISSLVAATDGGDLRRFVDTVAASTTELITITVTEAGYWQDVDGGLKRDASEVRADLETLARVASMRTERLRETLETSSVSTMPGRLLLGLEARRRRDQAAISIVPCDNISDNGATLRRLLRDGAAHTSSELSDYVRKNVTFVGTSVDRITPAATQRDRDAVAKVVGLGDCAVVVTEAFSDWTLAGAFAAARPRWEDAGARFVDDIAPYERRKLWLLNGAHSFLAYAGLLRGLTTVDEAVEDPELVGWVERFWDEAQSLLPAELHLSTYRRALLDRFANRGIRHQLRQISAEGSSKVALRIVPVMQGRHACKQDAVASTRALAAWIAWVLHGETIVDANIALLARARAQRDQRRAVTDLVALVDRRLSADEPLIDELADLAAELAATTPRRS